MENKENHFNPYLDIVKKYFPAEAEEEFGNLILLEKAVEVCFKQHCIQTRKADGKPYFIHPVIVALKLAKHGFPENVLAAALLHDVLEDTDYPQEKLKSEFGKEIFEMVTALTQDNKLSWKEKKKKYINSVQNSSDNVKAISTADKIHNIESLIMAFRKYGKEIWNKFNGSKNEKIRFEEELLKALKTGNNPLAEEFESLIKREKNLEE
jgi:(p)ppGpp synthase/HD superfamily hydrolase